MSHRRVDRLNEQLKRELSDLIRTRVRDPRVGLVTVTAVRTTTDLSVARVYVSTLDEDEAERDASLEGLEAASPYLRKLLGEDMKIRRVPELRFHLDETLDKALRIERLLEEVRPEEGWEEGEEEGTPGTTGGDDDVDGAGPA